MKIKYMGSKHHMLANGLGAMIREQSKYAKRIVDLFCGASPIAWYAAENTMCSVLAVDLQMYAVTLAKSVVSRTTSVSVDRLAASWLDLVERERRASRLWPDAVSLQKPTIDTPTLVADARSLCQQPLDIGPIWGAYGGYYFSPTQALTFDYLLKALPQAGDDRTICLAATIFAASKCAASPGHTAQPFRPTETAGPFLREAWARDPLSLCRSALDEICPRHASVKGDVLVSDALDVGPLLGPDDLVVVDPPYSGVQYSRFYHVLETVARGHCSAVQGQGRYPPIAERPQSAFGKVGQSQKALECLLELLAGADARVILTFPAGECSNGLSGEVVSSTAERWFNVEEKRVSGRFSTLGGNNSHRAARQASNELLLLLRPK